MSIFREPTYTIPEPRIRLPHTPPAVAHLPAAPNSHVQSRPGKIANQYSEGKAHILNVGFFEHSEKE